MVLALNTDYYFNYPYQFTKRNSFVPFNLKDFMHIFILETFIIKSKEPVFALILPLPYFYTLFLKENFGKRKRFAKIFKDSSVSGLISELKLRPLEQYIISKSKLKPKLWLDYVDDIFLTWKHGIPALK